MADALTYEKVLEIIKETNRLSSERLEKESRKRMREFDEELKKSRMEIKETNRLSSERLEKESRKRMIELNCHQHRLRKIRILNI